jgi:hypothetical protein
MSAETVVDMIRLMKEEAAKEVGCQFSVLFFRLVY